MFWEYLGGSPRSHSAVSAGSCWGYLLGPTMMFLGEVRRLHPHVLPMELSSPSVNKATMLHRSKKIEKRTWGREAETPRQICIHSFDAEIQSHRGHGRPAGRVSSHIMYHLDGFIE